MIGEGYSLLVVAAGLMLVVIIAYNWLIARKNHALEAWSGIDVQLKRRHDLLPKLVDVVKAYAKYEEQVLRTVTGMRAAAGITVHDRSKTENAVTASLRWLLGLAEAYPDLKANASYLDLQKQISTIEEQIQYARRYFNGTVREFNILVESFPSNLVARMFGFAVMDYFEIELATQRDSPDLKLG
ncbi:MAG: LemA family protein [Betaproteobacteria bacterium]|nr:LemA family protein [Betaproteobacteria bacterium]